MILFFNAGEVLIEMDFQKHLKNGWDNTIQFIGPVVLLTLVQVLVGLISFGLLAPVTMAGFIQSLLRAQREKRPPQIGDLFCEMKLFLPLLFLGFCIGTALVIGYLFLVLPGLLLTVFVAFAGLYIIPLMVDRRMGVIESVKGSWKLSVSEPITDQIVVSLLYAGIMSVGGSIFIIFLFAQPLATFILLSVYDEKMNRSGYYVEFYEDIVQQ